MTKAERQRLATGLLFISPWMVGFFALCAYPLLSSVYFSLCDYSVLSPAVFIGARNYQDLWADNVFWTSLYNTVFFAAFAIPLGLVVSLGLAILLNFNVPGKGVFRTIFFLPSLVPMVCLAVPYVMTGGGDGPERSLLFMATYLYQNAFAYWNMGYACAIGVILFLIILALTWISTKLSEKHVYYAGK